MNKAVNLQGAMFWVICSELVYLFCYKLYKTQSFLFITITKVINIINMDQKGKIG